MGATRSKSRGLDDTRRQILVFFACLLGLQAILLFVAIGYKTAQSDLHGDERVLLRARELAHNARVKSNELHLMAKDAAASGDPRDIRDYAVRARPQPTDADYGGGGALQSLMASLRRVSTRAAAFQDDELPKFEATIAAMQVQLAAEEKAVNALKGFFQDAKGEYAIEAPADPKLASQILSGPEYEKNVRAIQSGFSAFLSQLDVRLFAVHKESSRGFSLNFLIALASILLAATPAAGILLYRSVNTTVRKLKTNARNLTDELGRLNAELKTATASREDMRRRLERAEAAQCQPPPQAALSIPFPAPAQGQPPHGDPHPEFDDFLTRLP